MIRPSGSLPTPWQPATLSDLGRLPDCQAARRPRACVCMRAPARAGRPPELAAWQSALLITLFIVAACLAACLIAGSLPSSAACKSSRAPALVAFSDLVTQAAARVLL